MYFLLLHQFTSHWLLLCYSQYYDVAFLYNCWFLFIIIMGLLICKYMPFWQEFSVKSLILRWPLRPRGLLSSSSCQDVQMKGHTLFQGDNSKNIKIISKTSKIFFFRTTGSVSTKLGTKHAWVVLIKNCSNEWLHPSPSGNNIKIVKMWLSICMVNTVNGR